MLHTHLIWLWYAVPAIILVDAVGYTLGAIGRIRRALNPTKPYWPKRLLLNLMLANQGPYLTAAIPLVGAVKRGLRASVVRLPRLVHGLGERHGFIPMPAAVAHGKLLSSHEINHFEHR